MLKSLALIANPTAGVSAGRPNKQRTIEAAAREFEKRGFEVALFLENSSAAVEEKAAQAARDGVKSIVAAGGDGTVNAVVNGLMKSGVSLDELALGVIPLGTGNVFAFNLGIDREWKKACRVIRKGHTRRIDVGLARASTHQKQALSRYFLLMAGVGYDAKVIEDTSLRLKYVLRDFAYVLKTLENVVRHQGTQITLTLDSKTIYANIAWLVMIGNAASYAWNIKVTPHAQLDDGLLDVCLIPYSNNLISIQQALQVLTGQHIERGVAQYWQVKSVRVESSPNVPVQLDGDEWASTPVELSLFPGALRVYAPREPVIKAKVAADDTA